MITSAPAREGADERTTPARLRPWSGGCSSCVALPFGRGAAPIVYDAVPNFTGDAWPRRYALITDEFGDECASTELTARPAEAGRDV